MMPIRQFLMDNGKHLVQHMRRRRAAMQTRRQMEETMLDAIETVVEGTDPRLRFVSGYRKKMRPAIKSALHYISEAVEQIPEPIEISKRTWNSDPRVNAFFATVGDLQIMLSSSAKIRRFFEHGEQQEGYALLAMAKQEKTVLRHQLEGEILRREVPQVTISFSEHRILAPSATEAETRKELIRCAFNVLVKQALERLVCLQARKETLTDQRRLLKIRRKFLQAERASLTSLLQASESHAQDLEDILQKMAANKQNLLEAQAGIETLDDYLERVNEVLAHPENYLQLKMITIRLNRLGVKVQDNSPDAGNEITLTELTVGKQITRVVALVKYFRDEMLSREHLWEKTFRGLGD